MVHTPHPTRVAALVAVSMVMCCGALCNAVLSSGRAPPCSTHAQAHARSSDALACCEPHPMLLAAVPYTADERRIIGAAAAVPAVPAAQRGASCRHACRMRSHAHMSMRAAAVGSAHAARLAAWPLDSGRRTSLASVRARHTVTGTALCTLGLVRTSPSRHAYRGPYPDRIGRAHV